jgi:hypothetical protein
MYHDQHAIGGAVDVHLEHVHVHGRGTLKGIHGILGPQAAPATVSHCEWTVFELSKEGMLTNGSGKQHKSEVDNVQADEDAK